MRLLKITRQEFEEFDPLFEDNYKADVEDVAPSVIKGESDVKLNGNSISDYDAVFAEIPQKNAVFGRVMLEMIEEKDVRLNYPSTAFFIMAKKNYLYHVLHQKNIDTPGTVVVGSEKARRNIDEHLDYPMVARKFDSLSETERRLIESSEDIDEFAEGTEYPDEFIIFQEFDEGEKYRCLYIDGEIISLADGSDEWRFNQEKLKYSSLSNDQKEAVVRTSEGIGTPVAEVILRGNKVFDVNPNPDLKMYTEISGKNAFEEVAEVLRE